MSDQVGTVTWINGPVIRARGSRHVGMLELVEVGEEHLVGEVIGLDGDIITAQVYEETSGMRPGAPVFGTGLPLSVELGPGLLDEHLRRRAAPAAGDRNAHRLVHRPRHAPDAAVPQSRRGSSRHRRRLVMPCTGGAILGTVPETESLEHRMMVPPDMRGTLTWVAAAGEYTIEEPIARLKDGSKERELTMLQRWPVRRPRPYRSRLGQSTPLITGQRVLDTFFPVAKGGAAGIPGRLARARPSPSTASPSGRMPMSLSTSAAANAATR